MSTVADTGSAFMSAEALQNESDVAADADRCRGPTTLNSRLPHGSSRISLTGRPGAAFGPCARFRSDGAQGGPAAVMILDFEDAAVA